MKIWIGHINFNMKIKINGHKWARKLALQSPQEAHLLTGETLLDGPGSISKVEGSASQAPEA